MVIEESAGDPIQKGMDAADRGDTLEALLCLEKVAATAHSPLVFSYLAYCLARERGLVSDSLALCRDALQREPCNPLHYLNLGRVYLCASDKARAIRAFRKGLVYRKRHPLILRELDRIGVRRRPLLPFLERSNPLNRALGLAFARVRRPLALH